MSKSWIITTEENTATGEVILPLPPDLVESQGWQEGDILEWIENTDGSWVIRKSV